MISIKPPIQFIRELYPEETEEELVKIEENFRAYLELVKKIASRIVRQGLDKKKEY